MPNPKNYSTESKKNPQIYLRESKKNPQMSLGSTKLIRKHQALGVVVNSAGGLMFADYCAIILRGNTYNPLRQ